MATTVKNENIKKDCIYFAKNTVKNGVDYIFRCKNDVTGGYKTFIELSQCPNYYTANIDNYLWPGYDLRFPTTEEADWLIACEQAGHFIPQPEKRTESIINSYPIF